MFGNKNNQGVWSLNIPSGSQSAAIQLYQEAIAAGATPTNALYLVGSAIQESGLNPNKTGSDGGTSFGLMQVGKGLWNRMQQQGQMTPAAQMRAYITALKTNAPQTWAAMQKASTVQGVYKAQHSNPDFRMGIPGARFAYANQLGSLVGAGGGKTRAALGITGAAERIPAYGIGAAALGANLGIKAVAGIHAGREAARAALPILPATPVGVPPPNIPLSRPPTMPNNIPPASTPAPTPTPVATPTPSPAATPTTTATPDPYAAAQQAWIASHYPSATQSPTTSPTGTPTYQNISPPVNYSLPNPALAVPSPTPSPTAQPISSPTTSYNPEAGLQIGSSVPAYLSPSGPSYTPPSGNQFAQNIYGQFISPSDTFQTYQAGQPSNMVPITGSTDQFAGMVNPASQNYNLASYSLPQSQFDIANSFLPDFMQPAGTNSGFAAGTQNVSSPGDFAPGALPSAEPSGSGEASAGTISDNPFAGAPFNESAGTAPVAQSQPVTTQTPSWSDLHPSGPMSPYDPSAGYGQNYSGQASLPGLNGMPGRGLHWHVLRAWNVWPRRDERGWWLHVRRRHPS
jgi:hypothetical protein